MTSKTCRICLVEQPTENFYSGRADCKPCDNAKNLSRKRWAYRPEQNHTPGPKERKRRWQRANYDPAKRAARRVVRRAVDTGLLRRPDTCSACGEAAARIDGVTAIQAHHLEGYDRPLAVVFMCPKCHAAEHKSDAARRAGEGEVK